MSAEPLNWAAFEDLMQADEVLDLDEETATLTDTSESKGNEVPVYGWRILCTLDSDGQRWYRWSLTGDPELQETVATLERVKFVLQAHEYAHNADHGSG